MKHFVIGNPENRRVVMFQEAVQRANLPPACVIAYENLLCDRSVLGEINENSIVRIDSPGENHVVEIGLIGLGADAAANDKRAPNCQSISCKRAAKIPFDRGRIQYLRQWFLGYFKLLQQIEASLPTSTRWHNAPKGIALMFDKVACQKKLAAAGLPVPESIPKVTNFDELIEEMRRRQWNRVFVKPAHGSSSSGVIALAAENGRLRAVTSIELVRRAPGQIGFYNNLKVRTYENRRDLRTLINFVLRESAIVQQWLPKAVWQGREFDLRIVVVAGKACHAVVRSSRFPMTNLHLGNRRGDLQEVIEQVGKTRWRRILDVCENAASVIPNSLYIGVDVLLLPRTFSPVIIELNAFGDLLPGVLFHGQTTYGKQILALKRLYPPLS